MAHADTTNQAATLAQTYRPGFESAVYRNGGLTSLFPKGKMTSAVERWTPNTAGNTSTAIYAEGDAAPSPGYQAYSELSAEPVYFWSWARISGRQRDIAKLGGHKPGLNVLDTEIMGAFEDIKDLVNTTFMGSTYGLEHICSASNTVFGVAQASNAWHQATVQAVGTTLSRAVLTNNLEYSRDNDKGASIGLFLSPHNQVTNYTNLTGEPGATNNSVRVTNLQNGVDIGANPDMVSFATIPWLGVGDMTDTAIIGLDLRPTRYGPNVEFLEARPLEIAPPVRSGDDDVYAMSHATAFVVRLVKRTIGLSTVTA